MPKLSLLALLILLSSGTAFAQNKSTERALSNLLTEFLDGAGRNDAEIHQKFWAEDVIYTRASGQRTTKAEIMKSVRSAPEPKPEDPKTVYSAEEVQIRQYGNTAVVAFRLVGTTTGADGTKTVQKFYNTGTFVKRNGVWQAVAWQATAIPSDRP